MKERCCLERESERQFGITLCTARWKSFEEEAENFTSALIGFAFMSVSFKIAFDSAFAAPKRHIVVSFDIWVSFSAKARLSLRQLCEIEKRLRRFQISNSEVAQPVSCVIVNFCFSQNSNKLWMLLDVWNPKFCRELCKLLQRNSVKTCLKFPQEYPSANHPFVTSNFKAFRSLSFWLRNRELNFPLSFIRKLRLPSPTTLTPSVARPEFHSLRPNDLPQSRKHERKTIGPVNAFPSRVANSGLRRSHSLTLMSLSHLRLHFTNKKRKQQKKLK